MKVAYAFQFFGNEPARIPFKKKCFCVLCLLLFRVRLFHQFSLVLKGWPFTDILRIKAILDKDIRSLLFLYKYVWDEFEYVIQSFVQRVRARRLESLGCCEDFVLVSPGLRHELNLELGTNVVFFNPTYSRICRFLSGPSCHMVGEVFCVYSKGGLESRFRDVERLRELAQASGSNIRIWEVQKMTREHQKIWFVGYPFLCQSFLLWLLENESVGSLRFEGFDFGFRDKYCEDYYLFGHEQRGYQFLRSKGTHDLFVNTLFLIFAFRELNINVHFEDSLDFMTLTFADLVEKVFRSYEVVS